MDYKIRGSRWVGLNPYWKWQHDFDEGNLSAKEVYHIMTEAYKNGRDRPKGCLEEDLFNKVRKLAMKGESK